MVRRGLAGSRAEAVRAIDAGQVRVGGVPQPKPATLVDGSVPVSVERGLDRYVSRGGDKLAGALEDFQLTVHGRRALDVGASTGGFTDCLLQHGAVSVVALDVGYGQLAWELRQDPRVTVREKTNFRYAKAGELGGPFEVIVADLSFISLCTVAPVLAECSTPATDLVLLVKPQFEVGQGEVGKGGVVRDPEKHRAALRRVIECLAEVGLGVYKVTASPIEGAKGNREFFVLARPGEAAGIGEDVVQAVTR